MIRIDPEQLDPERQLTEETLTLYYPLCEVLGEEVARIAIVTLIECVGGERFYINSPDAIVLEQSRAPIIKLLQEGLHPRVISQQLGIRLSFVLSTKRAFKRT